jgi:hypothetical protein
MIAIVIVEHCYCSALLLYGIVIVRALLLQGIVIVGHCYCMVIVIVCHCKSLLLLLSFIVIVIVTLQYCVHCLQYCSVPDSQMLRVARFKAVRQTGQPPARPSHAVWRWS